MSRIIEDEDKMDVAHRRTLGLLKWLTDDVFVPGAVATIVVRVPDKPGVELFYTWGEHILDTRSVLQSIAGNMAAIERIVFAHSGEPISAPVVRCFTNPQVSQ